MLLNLGKVNILTGRNSSGKSTILRIVFENPDIGITYSKSDEIKNKILSKMGKYTRPTQCEIDDWINKILLDLDGKIFFKSTEHDARDLVTKSKKKSLVNSYGLDSEIIRIAGNLVDHPKGEGEAVLLSPKRRLRNRTIADIVQQLDSEADKALSRLFFLKNQMSDSKDKIIFDKIYRSFYDITGSEFDIQILPEEKATTIQLFFRRKKEAWIVAQKEGLGFTEILSILLYSLDGSHKLLLIEEPENHLHPDFQRRLLSFLITVENRQFILSTHSPVFLNPTMVDRIYLCKYVNGEIIIDDNTSRAEALSNIGVLAIDNLTSDAVLITEGKNDQIVIDHIVKKWLSAPANASISHVFLSGSMMMYFDPTPFAQIRNTFTLLDLDTNNSSAQKKFKEACSAVGIIPTQLSRYCLENYYTLDAIRATFGELIPSQIKSLDKTIPPWKQIADANHDENWWKGELKSFRRITSILNNMKVSNIEGTDLLEFCKKIISVL